MTQPIKRPLTRMRRSIAKAMTASALVPQFTLEWEPAVTALDDLRRELTPDGTTVSYTDIFVAACARALRDYPQFNSSFQEDAVLEHSEVNIGLAVAIEDGLITPAIRRADGLTLQQIARDRKRLSTAAQEGRLTPEDLFSATFTISNLGAYGVPRFHALVVPPQAAILALGAITPQRTVCMALSCDHRVLDGALAAEFLRDLAGLLERPDWISAKLEMSATEPTASNL